MPIRVNSFMEITKDILIEDLVELKHASINYLARKGIKCIACGEPIWGSLEQAAKDKGFDDQAIEGFVSELNQLP